MTYIHDDVVLVQNDKNRYWGNHVYEEYHASQVELLKLLRVKNIHDTFMFSMRDKIDTVTGKKSIDEYVEEAHKHASDYKDLSDYTVIKEFLTSQIEKILNSFMEGWFDTGKVEQLCKF